jgi:hypothetical protein
MLYKDVNLINTEIDNPLLHRKRLELLQKISKSKPTISIRLCSIIRQSQKIIQNHHEKTIYILSSLFLVLQAQVIPQPKPAAPPTIKIGKSNNFELKNGLKVMVVENHKLRVAYSLA